MTNNQQKLNEELLQAVKVLELEELFLIVSTKYAVESHPTALVVK